MLILLLNALFASTFTFGKIVLHYTNPIFFVGVSMFMGGCMLLGYQHIKDPAKLKIAIEDRWAFLQVSIFSIFLGYTLYFWGLKFLPSFKACFLYNFGPFISYIIGCFLFDERMLLKKWIGLMIGLIGLLPMLTSAFPQEQNFLSVLYVSLPEIAVITSVTVYSYGWFIVRRLVYNKQYSSLTVNGISMVIGGLLSLLSVPFVEGSIVIKEFLPFFSILLVTILIEYIICNQLYAILLKKYSETFLSFSTFLIPFFGALYGWLFLKEEITWHFFISSFIIAYAISFFYKAEMGKNS